MIESWRPVKGYEGLYEVSNLSNIRSKDKVVECRNNYDIRSTRVMKGRVLKPLLKHSRDKAKYYYVTLCDKDHIKKRYKWHTVVAKSFPELCGQWFEGCEVHHKDFNASNNLPQNLICFTKLEHILVHKLLNNLKKK